MKLENSEYPAFCICIVTFFPTQETIYRINQLEKRWPIWVFDNTPNQKLGQKLGDSVRLVKTNRNEGLGYALNYLMRETYQAGFERALYFDQDTLFDEMSLKWIRCWIKDHVSDISTYPILNFLPVKSQQLKNEGGLLPQRLLINSASLFHLPKLSEVGFHNRQWFLECVDYEMNLRMALSGYSMASVLGCPGLNHELEQPASLELRIYPLKRTLIFCLRLCQLSVFSLTKGRIDYAWIFFRNILTHALAQFKIIIQRVFR